MGRWRRHLDPSVTRSAWKASEDEALQKLYTLHGPKWSLICQSVSGRTAQQCRARWFQVESLGNAERASSPRGETEGQHAGRESPRTSAPRTENAAPHFAQPFQHILEESARAAGSLDAYAPLLAAVKKFAPISSKAPHMSEMMDPMALWRDSDAIPRYDERDVKRKRVDDAPARASTCKPTDGKQSIASTVAPSVPTPPQRSRSRPPASTKVDRAQSDDGDKLSFLYTVALNETKIQR